MRRQARPVTVTGMTNLSVTERPRLTAIRASWLFDGTGSVLIADPLVVFDSATIRSAESGGDAPDGACVVDLDGATLLPGLVDTHVHLAFDASLDPVGNLAARDDGAVLAAMAEAGRASLRAGVTTVRDLGDRGYLSLRLRDREDQPTVVAAGPPITSPGDTATSWAESPNRLSPACGRRCASTSSTAWTSSRSWPAAER